MGLPTAPCTRCGSVVVYGERRCRACGEAFDYGPQGPPEPTPQQVSEALLAADLGFENVYTGPGSERAVQAYQAHARAEARAVTVPGGVPVVPAPPAGPPGQQAYAPPAPAAPAYAPPAQPAPAYAPPAYAPPAYAPQPPPPQAPAPAALDNSRAADPDIDTGRFGEVGEVALEDVPGLIDSRLFGAMTPAHVAVAPMEGLEATVDRSRLPDVGPDPTMAMMLDTGRFEDVGDTAREEIPGFIDSSLFAAYTPAVVQTEYVEGLEVNVTAATRSARPAGKGPSGEMGHCLDCGALRDVELESCPECGGRRLRS